MYMYSISALVGMLAECCPPKCSRQLLGVSSVGITHFPMFFLTPLPESALLKNFPMCALCQLQRTQFYSCQDSLCMVGAFTAIALLEGKCTSQISKVIIHEVDVDALPACWFHLSCWDTAAEFQIDSKEPLLGRDLDLDLVVHELCSNPAGFKLVCQLFCALSGILVITIPKSLIQLQEIRNAVQNFVEVVLIPLRWMTGCLENYFWFVANETQHSGSLPSGMSSELLLMMGSQSCARNMIPHIAQITESAVGTDLSGKREFIAVIIANMESLTDCRSTKMLLPIAGSFLSCLPYSFARIGPPEKFPHDSLCMVLVFICVRHQRRLTVLLPGNEKLGCQSEVVLLQVRALLISTSEFSIWLPESWQLQPNQGSIVVLGGQMDLIAFGRLSSSQFALGSLALSHNLGACNISCLSYSRNNGGAAGSSARRQK
ncbi:hypothetical protein Pelo_4879 [Pelomyxa schiedti]|nr:hypothetical protein Pelo_4879 [Pelomyxa schiedti]